MASGATERHPLSQATGAIGRRYWMVAIAVALGLIGGALAEHKPTDAYLACVVIVALLSMAMLGERAFPWAIVIVSVLPWYPFIAESAEPPIVRQKVLCAAIALAPLLPWLWAVALRRRRQHASRPTLLLGVLYIGLAILIYSTVGSVSGMIESKIVGFLFAGVTFLCARRFGDGRGWLAAACAGLILLVVMGADAYVRAPENRVGYFVGYPITYGALVVGLLPAGVLFAYNRSRLLAGALALAAGAMLIFSESRSSWIAIVGIGIVAIVLQVRAGNLRALAAVAVSAVLLLVLVTSTSSLSNIVEKRLSSNLTQSQSYTHRNWSYSYAVSKISEEPVFGAGVVGFSAEESNNRTSIGAIDNGYLSITVDMGLLGLAGALVPIGVAVVALARCLRFGVIPRHEVALALGIVGMAFVTIFYDSFYWAQIDLLLGALGGALSVRIKRIGTVSDVDAPARAARRTRARRRRIRWAT